MYYTIIADQTQYCKKLNNATQKKKTLKVVSKFATRKRNHLILIVVGLVVSLSMPVGTVFATSAYQSGYDHGCDDAKIPYSELNKRYIEQPEKGRGFHTDEFLAGYDKGFEACGNPDKSSLPDSNLFVTIVTKFNHEGSGTAKYCITGSFEEMCKQFELDKTENPSESQFGRDFKIGENFVYCYELLERPETRNCDTDNRISEGDNYKLFTYNLPGELIDDKVKKAIKDINRFDPF